jgi:transposase-like protein
MDFSQNIRRMIYTTNPVETQHRMMQKETKTKGAWSNDKGLIKQLYLTLMHNKQSLNRTAFSWPTIQKEFLDQFGHRFERYLL